MIYGQDVKLLSMMYTQQSSLPKEEKKQIYEFIAQNPVEESMNLLMTGSVDKLSEGKRNLVREKFGRSEEYQFINYLNEQVDKVSTEIVTEGYFPTDNELKALGYFLKYLKTPVGKLHFKATTKVADAVANLSGDTFNMPLLGKTIRPDKIEKYMNVWQGSFSAIGALGATAILAAVFYMGTKIYKKVFDKYAKKCAGVNGKANKLCVAAAKMNAYEVQMKAVQGKKSLCSKSKDAAKCKAKFDKKLSKMQNKLQDMQKAVAAAKSILGQAAAAGKKAKQAQDKKKG